MRDLIGKYWDQMLLNLIMCVIRVIKMLMHFLDRNVVHNLYYLLIKIGIQLSYLRVKAGLFDGIKNLAEKRNLKNLTICPVLTWNN